MNFSFSKKEKLKSKILFDTLFTEGKSIRSKSIKLIYVSCKLPEDVPLQVGVTVPKKLFKSAVHRNKIKRLLREAYRLNKHLIFNNTDTPFTFLFLYLSKEMPLYKDVEKDLIATIHKFNERIAIK